MQVLLGALVVGLFIAVLGVMRGFAVMTAKTIESVVDAAGDYELE